MAATRVFGACSRALMAVAAKGATSGVKTAAKMATPKRGNALQKMIPVSPQLGRFLSASEASHTDVVKKVWEHIKLHNLQVVMILLISQYKAKGMVPYYSLLSQVTKQGEREGFQSSMAEDEATWAFTKKK